MVLDGFMVISDKFIEDSYTLQLTDMIISKEEQYENILIFGGGDFLIAHYLNTHYKNFKNIYICDIDKKLMDNTMQYFNFA